MQQPHLFANLPLDMIQFEIFPYLDYDTRVKVNLMLPVQDRIRTPLKKDAALQFAMALVATRLTSIMNKIAGNLDRRAVRNRYLLKLFRDIPKYFFVLQYNSKLREAILLKCADYSDPDNQEYANASPHVKKTLPDICRAILHLAETKPLMYEIQGVSKNMPWTPLKNANPIEVVDNFARVAAAVSRKKTKGVQMNSEWISRS